MLLPCRYALVDTDNKPGIKGSGKGIKYPCSYYIAIYLNERPSRKIVYCIFVMIIAAVD